MVADRIFRLIPPDRPEFEMATEKWNYLITMTARIQNVISSAVIVSWSRTMSFIQDIVVSNSNYCSQKGNENVRNKDGGYFKMLKKAFLINI